mgnify:CR=1 FL=1
MLGEQRACAAVYGAAFATNLVLCLILARWFHRATWERMGNPLFLIPPLILVAIPAGLILKQPNLGTALITWPICPPLPIHC